MLLESELAKVKAKGSSRLYSRVKQLLHNPRKCTVLFSNNTSQFTHTPRDMSEALTAGGERILVPEPLAIWHTRARYQAIKWYQQHLLDHVETSQMLSLHVDRPPVEDEMVHSMQLADFVHSCLAKQRKDLSSLYESLEQVRCESLIAQTVSNAEATDNFSEHLTAEAMRAGISSGSLFRGILQVDKRSPQEATVRLSQSASAAPFGELFISSAKWQNRAIQGDEVAVQLLPKNQWKAPSRSSRRPEEDKLDESEVVDTTDETLEGLPPVTLENDSIADSQIPCGRVVGILQRNWRVYAGTLQESDRSDSRHLLAIPMDIRIPKIRISSGKGAELASQRLALRLDDWPVKSQYPNGHYVSVLGPAGDIDAETKGKALC